MPSLAEMLGYIVQPLGSPTIPILPKSPSNATGGSIPGVPGPKGPPLSSPSEMMAALTAIRNAGTAESTAKSEAELRKAQIEELQRLSSLREKIPGQFDEIMRMMAGGGAGAISPTSGPAFGSLGEPSLNGSRVATPVPALDFGAPGEYGAAQNTGGVGGRLSFDQVAQVARDVGFAPDRAQIMAATVMGESGGNPYAKKEDKVENSYGLTQINANAHGDKAREALGNPRRALELAFDISKGGKDFSPWTVYKSGDYKKYLPTAGGPPSDAIVGGDRPALPPGTQFNSRGFAVSPDLSRVLPGQQRGAPMITPTGLPSSFGTARPWDAEFGPDQSGRIGGIAPMSLAPAAALPATPSATPSISPLALAIARLGAMGTLSKMGDVAGPLEKALYNSPGFQGQVAGAKKEGEFPWATAETRFKADLDARNAAAKAEIDRINSDLLAGRAAGPGGSVVPRPGFAGTEATTRGEIAGAEASAKSETELARDLFQAQLARASKQLEQSGAAALDPTTIRIGDQEFPVTRKQYADIVAGGAAPGGAGLQPGGVVLGRNIPAEETRKAQTSARIAVDTKAAQDVGTQATLARRLIPLVDEVVRRADTTPEGWAGPVAASLSRGFSAFGVPVTEKMTNAELLESVSRQLIPLVREPGATSERELANYLKAVPGLMQSAEGRKKIAGSMKSIMQGSIDIADVYRNNIGAPDLSEKLAKLSDERRSKIDRELGGNEAPPGGKQIGTYKGKPVYEMPDGSRKVLQ